jgi:hypothetical protein
MVFHSTTTFCRQIKRFHASTNLAQIDAILAYSYVRRQDERNRPVDH